MRHFAVLGFLAVWWVPAACGDEDVGRQDASVEWDVRETQGDASSWRDAAARDAARRDGPPADGGEPAALLDELVEAFVAAQCQGKGNCGLLVGPGSTMPLDKCERLVRDGWYEKWRVVVEAALARGSVSLDEEKVHECIQALERADCPALARWDFPACDQVLQPAVPAGGECHFDEECLSGFCAGLNSGDCPGQCQVPPDEGEDCSDTRRCQPGFACVDTGFMEYRCVAERQVGQSCTDSQECEWGLYCDSRTSTCQEWGWIGASCSEPDACAPSLFCRDGTCQTMEVVSTEGGTCDIEQGLLCDYDAGLTCHFDTGQCGPVGSVGDACTTSGDCDFLDQLYCDPSSQTCAQQKDLGESCASWEECRVGTCDSDTGTCAYPECL